MGFITLSCLCLKIQHLLLAGYSGSPSAEGQKVCLSPRTLSMTERTHCHPATSAVSFFPHAVAAHPCSIQAVPHTSSLKKQTLSPAMDRDLKKMTWVAPEAMSKLADMNPIVRAGEQWMCTDSRDQTHSPQYMSHIVLPALKHSYICHQH